ncbi:MAG: energy transducer TonB [Acidobacteriota bacterium]
MNQLEEEKSLAEFLQAALEEARDKPSHTTGRQIHEIEQELREALSAVEKLSREPALAPCEVTVAVRTNCASSLQATVKLSLEWEPRYRTFISNLKSAFNSQPRVYVISAKPAETGLLLESAPRWITVWSNLRSFVRPRAKDYSYITAQPVATNLLLEELPWYRAIFAHLKYLFLKEESAAIEITAQPTEVGDLFRDYRFRSRSLVLSVLAHLTALAAMLLLPSLFIGDTKKIKVRENQISLLDTSKIVLRLPLKATPGKSGGGGGGGRREPTPASLGRLPRPADRQLTPPVPKVINLDPILPVEPTVVVPQLAQLPTVNLANYGDPFGVPGPPSSGPGTGGGIGTGTGGGVGPGKGPGVGPGEGGGIGGGVFRVGGGVSAPTIIYRVEPLYSEEARKAKYQGVVVLSAIVRKDGTLEILKIVRGLGLGLDESAIQALRKWRFRPGMKDGVPVDVVLNVEVNFTLR